MFHWLHRLSTSWRRPPAREALLNEGLEIAMDWGENWLAPIQERLHRRHARLSPEVLDGLDADCRAAMKFGHEAAYALANAQGRNDGSEAFQRSVRAAFPWISDENLARLLNQSLYYAWKTGGPPRNA